MPLNRERKAETPKPFKKDKPEEACGVYGVFAPKEDVARLTYFGLHALQHRGQESAGIAVGDGNSIFVVKDMGLVPLVFNEKSLAGLQGNIALGHVRYSTTGSTKWENAQPIHKTFKEGTLALAHNGNLVNSKHLKEMLTRNGSFFNSTSDTEVIADLIASFVGDGSVEKAILQTMNLLEGAYSVAMITEDKLYAFRDPHGIRPLCIGKLKNNYIISSETCGLDIIGAKFVDQVKPGELIVISSKGMKRKQILEAKPSLCIFEFIYFARPDSELLKKNLYHCRKKMGKYLAQEAPAKADMVIGVPDSGVPAAIGFAEEAKLPYGEGLIKNRYIGRTFIEPSQTIREVGIRMKLNPLASTIKGKKIVVVDDSIVRGNTTKKIIGLLKEAGAKEVHVRISSPPYKYPCFYGIDTDSIDELVASKNSVEQIRKWIKADSLYYLSLKSLIKATGCKSDSFCTACLTGEYPVKISDELKLSKLMLEKTSTK
ncbi:MAG: amidophosphoribosyltransferase [Actinobacteria bacterium]|nr:MAG: amidophosphoribosyltransferase [Actinomycetota bacterium]